MKCQNCGNEFTGDFCKACGWDPSMGDAMKKAQTASTTNNTSHVVSSTEEENSVSKACKGIASIYMVVMVIGSMIWGFQTADALYNSAIGWGIFLGGSLLGLVTGMILFGIGEIIRLLHEQKSQ